jgi:PAS domain S-box-containing protein
MKERKAHIDNISELRLKAEKLLAENQLKSSDPSSSSDEMIRMAHELEVHRIMLEMQQQELCQTSDELEKSLEQFADLYDFAPLGYVTIERSGSILDVNLTAARMLDTERATLLGSQFSDHILAEDISVFTAFLGKVFKRKASKCCEIVRLKEPEGKARNTASPGNANPLTVSIDAVVRDKGETCRLVLSDISRLKEIENAMLHTNERMQFIMKATHSGTWEWDLQGDNSIWSDEIWSAIDKFGLNPRSRKASYELWQDFILPEDRDRIDKIVTDALHNEEEFTVEWRVRDNAGKDHWAMSKGTPLKGDDDKVRRYGGFLIDITELKKAQEISNKAQALNKTIIDSIPGPFYIIDKNGFYAGWNAYDRDVIAGKPENEMAAMQVIATVHPEDRAHIQEKISSVFEHGIDVSVEGRILLRGGPDYRWFVMSARRVMIDGNPFLIGIGTDVTERKKIEDELKRLSFAITQSPAVVVITDPQGHIEYVNPAFSLHTGYSQNEVIGENPRILQSGMMPQDLYANLWKTILSGRIWQGDMQNRKKNGELYWETAVISAIRNENGDITNFVAVKEDITENKKLWSELVAAKEKAEESDRLKSAFLANISHEIRTPMNGILGFSELLKDANLSGDEQQEYIDLIHQSGERMLSIINDLIDISRIDANEVMLNIGESNLNKLLHDLCFFFTPEAEKLGLKLNCSKGLPDSECVMETDAKKLEQVLTNLVQNALKFTNEGHIDIGYTKKESMLEFFVADTGIGIPEEMRKGVFDRFRQVDNSITRPHEGVGLGLSISKGFVEMLGGTIWVEPADGGGSRFLFTLPYNPPEVTKKPLTDLADQEIPEYSAPKSGLTILIAEDDEISFIFLKAFLKTENITLLSAGNGRDAVEMCRQHPEIDLVLMDIKMPVMNGYDATRMIKELRHALPVIAQTAFTSPEVRNKAKEAGCDAFITKPVNKDELLELIRVLLKR